MGLINILQDDLINQIAAGEVVERPSSVVKELVENSIDAGAEEIIIEIEDGGRKCIKVTDNGSGMSPEDAVLSLRRHATSKITTLEDLYDIGTLGFRGEAIPSIASVSRFHLSTVARGAAYGTSIKVEAGRIIEKMDFGGPAGTSIEVRDLFYNVPARLKFMKSVSTELSHISEVVTRIALSHPEIRIHNKHNGAGIYNLAKSADPLTRICLVMSEERDNFLEVSLSSRVRVRGYISGPDINRPTGKGIYVFVNGRFVRDRIVMHAVMEAYRAVMEKDRYPLAFLAIDVPPGDVDVNVHPAKSEVRFRSTDEIHRCVYACVSEGLKGWSRKKASPDKMNALSTDHTERVREALGRYGSSIDMSNIGVSAASISNSMSKGIAADYPSHQPDLFGTDEGLHHGLFSSMKILGSLGNTYIVCSGMNGLVIIDQHAAHERISFERLKNNYAKTRPEQQRLLLPETVSLPLSEAELLSHYIEPLAMTGFEIERFSGNDFVIKAVPALLSKADAKALLRDVADELAESGRSSGLEKIMDRIISRMACHVSIEAGDVMASQEVKRLLSDLDDVDFSSSCPHGRPVFIMFSSNELEKMFLRK